MRRAGSVLLVQWASGGSLGDAASYLGIASDDPSTHSDPPWPAGSARTDQKTSPQPCTTSPRNWTPPPPSSTTSADARPCANGAWPRAPGKRSPAACRPSRDHSSRSWTTGSGKKHPPSSGPTSPRASPGSPPRPIEASQPEPVRKDWAARRGSTWHKLARPGRFIHYAELRKLLIKHASHLARGIDNGDHSVRSQQGCPRELFTAAGYPETVTPTAWMIQSRRART
jgi:hypothetical protein